MREFFTDTNTLHMHTHEHPTRHITTNQAVPPTLSIGFEALVRVARERRNVSAAVARAVCGAVWGRPRSWPLCCAAGPGWRRAEPPAAQTDGSGRQSAAAPAFPSWTVCDVASGPRRPRQSRAGWCAPATRRESIEMSGHSLDAPWPRPRERGDQSLSPRRPPPLSRRHAQPRSLSGHPATSRATLQPLRPPCHLRRKREALRSGGRATR